MPQMMKRSECMKRNVASFNSLEDKQICGSCRKELNEGEDVYYVLFNFRFEPGVDKHLLGPKYGNVANEIIGHFRCIHRIYQEIREVQHAFFTKEDEHHKTARIEVNRRHKQGASH
jgi:hypothetical protein